MARFQAGRRYWWSEARKKRSKRHLHKGHVKKQTYDVVHQKNQPKGPLG